MRNILLLLITLISLGNFLSAQDSTSRYLPKGLSFEATYTGDLAGNLRGGISRGTAYLGLAGLKLSFNTEDAGLYKGGELCIHAANTHGGDPSANLTGDFQVFSNLEAGDHTYIQELWYRQTFGNATVIIGLQDLCCEMMSDGHAALFLNSSFGVPSTVASNVPAPIFPLTSLGLQVQYRITANYEVKLAIFDGMPEDFSSNPHNLKWRIDREGGLLSLGELTIHKDIMSLPGTYKMGYYYHSGSLLPKQEGKETGERLQSNHGAYLAAAQSLLEPRSSQSLNLFLQAGLSPPAINENYYYLGAGLNYSGWRIRPDDMIGLAIAHAGFKDRMGETAIELTYRMKLDDRFFLQPDLQYIIHPSGTPESLDNAFVATLRFGFSFAKG